MRAAHLHRTPRPVPDYRRIRRRIVPALALEFAGVLVNVALGDWLWAAYWSAIVVLYLGVYWHALTLDEDS